ncbi:MULTISPECIES: M24 family metallopeptidase [unclassified Pseudomonas]|uniref:M24 family metallopeptidase n=1 Tax=unclassified Pseudomonas TaxID=196821 RepID=UPI000876635A|nr:MULTISPECIES: M24 family metallopeptidase [unclassified Pseudomonas]SCZ75289.1 Metallopeptidase family M24 [Pseudomonas sp. NFPP17]SDA87436.1 Metallopeptidase family M24 [Pseudomonas sp. NFPP15]SEL87604.1 Metallopeptidase family M24 [Pseudomonas sp. NFPP18]SFA67834.1 Metallopeptidase family M24 [Pseudomonas sp. NFPP13]SFU10513.1 Metallopeptidase family M24 [Pseudomonas sp. NFPP25]
MIATSKEAVGLAYSLEGMLHAKRMTWEAIGQIARQVKPGMQESAAREMGLQVLREMGMERIWHPLLIRFGANTLKTFKQRSDGDPLLQENDLFFIDLGVVWDRHEGDCGATFVVGDDAEMHACAAAAKSLFDQVHDHWQSHQMAGPELYRYAQEQARAMGWVLNLDIKGHRVSDFPHAIYRAGDLGDFAACPQVGLWILEIQISHPTRPFGAFYEDLLA